MATSDYKVIDQQVGLLGATVLLVGTVVGISVFLLPGELIAEAGPSITLALLVTVIPMTFSVLTLLQLGGAIPVAGGLYVYASRLVGPFWGFLAIWLMVPAIWSVLLFTSIGFAQFTRFFVDIPAEPLMAGILAFFLLLNLKGITVVTQVQLAMVVTIILGMLTFIIPGTGSVSTANYSPMFPGGAESFIVAIVSLYIPFQGFTMIVELGEELENPVKNIPRVLGLGMVISVVLSVGLVAVFAGVGDWQTLAGHEEAAVAHAAGTFLPDAGSAIVALAAVMGALTTINALITSYSRTIMRAARDEVMPTPFAAIHPHSDVPYWAIVLLGLPPILMVPVSPTAVTLSIFLALILLFGGFLGSIALWRLPTVFPMRYEHSLYKLPMPVLKIAAVGGAFFSALFWLLVLTEIPWLVGIIAALVALGYLAYTYRVRSYEAEGVDLKERMALLHKHEQVGDSSSSSADD